MQQYLPCTRCDDWDMIDFGLPADLCRRCLRALGFPGLPQLTDEDLEILENAACAVDLRDATWKEAVEEYREKISEGASS